MNPFFLLIIDRSIDTCGLGMTVVDLFGTFVHIRSHVDGALISNNENIRVVSPSLAEQLLRMENE